MLAHPTLNTMQLVAIRDTSNPFNQSNMYIKIKVVWFDFFRSVYLDLVYSYTQAGKFHGISKS